MLHKAVRQENSGKVIKQAHNTDCRLHNPLTRGSNDAVFPGALPVAFGNSPRLMSLDMSWNSFTGARSRTAAYHLTVCTQIVCNRLALPHDDVLCEAACELHTCAGWFCSRAHGPCRQCACQLGQPEVPLGFLAHREPTDARCHTLISSDHQFLQQRYSDAAGKVPDAPPAHMRQQGCRHTATRLHDAALPPDCRARAN